MTLTDGQNGGTNLAWAADIHVVGTVASMAARLMGGVTKKLTETFFDKVREEIETYS
jgi:carbon monoxide dehydrogenase subunit G